MDPTSPLSEFYGASESDETPTGWGSPDMMLEVSNIHAQHVTAVTSQATSAAWHADIAAKQAANLAQWVQYLWTKVARLQQEVQELEDWKKKTMEEVAKLRTAHRILQRKVMPDGPISDEVPGVPKAKSTPRLRVASQPSPTPPGLEQTPPALPAALSNFSICSSDCVSPATPIPQALAADDGPPEGVRVELLVIDGEERQCAQWRIRHLSAKLKSCMGRSLVSSPFAAYGLEDLRLMIFPEGKDSVKASRNKTYKDQYAKMVTEGPLDACLKFKVPECPPPHVVEYYLKIGDIRKGPFKHNFSESIVNGCSDFGVDWLKQVESDQSLTVTVEILPLQG